MNLGTLPDWTEIQITNAGTTQLDECIEGALSAEKNESLLGKHLGSKIAVRVVCKFGFLPTPPNPIYKKKFTSI